MELYQAIILGMVQGLTEFLPVSSSGHLVLGQIFFGMTQSQLMFDISVHMGTLFAVVVVYRSDIKNISMSILRFLLKPVLKQSGSAADAAAMSDDQENLKLAYLIIIGSVPTALIGFLIKQFEHFLFTSKVLVGVMLLITGTILWISRSYYFNEKKRKPLDIKTACLIGTVQGLAVIPGISRSGSTIATGLIAGLDRSRAAKFSFLLSIPAIAGAQLLSIKDMLEKSISIDLVTIYATIVSFITGYIALKILLSLVHSGRFHLFAPYCWLIGILVILSKII